MSYLLSNFENAAIYYKKSRRQKLKESPINIIYPELLRIITSILKVPVKLSVKTFWGDKMKVVIPELISLCILKYRVYEEGLTKMLLEYLKPGMVFIDVGAHFGYFSLLASYIVGNTGQVHSFEPTPSSFNILRNNTYNKKNIVINNKGVFSVKTDILLNDYGLTYSSFNSIYRARLPIDTLAKIDETTHKIKCILIDEYVDENNLFPNFIKIDAESSEYEIIKGMEKTIKKCHPLISLEMGDMGIENIAKSSELIKLLISKNYKPCIFNGSIIINYDKMDISCRYDNMLFMPS
jgi:FkbM family methyltransferase